MLSRILATTSALVGVSISAACAASVHDFSSGEGGGDPAGSSAQASTAASGGGGGGEGGAATGGGGTGGVGGGGGAGPCVSDADCDDANACTMDTCDLQMVVCVYTKNPGVEIEAENAALVKQTGSWFVANGGVLHGGQGLLSSDVYIGEYIEFDFMGTEIILYHEVGPNGGTMDVTIDNGPTTTVDSNKQPDFEFQVPVVLATGLAPGVHHLVITDTSPANFYVRPDYFGVSCQ